MATRRGRLWTIVTIPLAIVLIVFAVANGQEATVSLWPLHILVSLPVFLLTLGSFALGLLVGAILFWIPLTHWRTRARRREKRVVELEGQMEQLDKTRAADAALPIVNP